MQQSSILDEKSLFAAIAKGEEAAFTELFKRYDKRIYYFTLKMIKTEDLAEEITQDVFIKLWEKRETLVSVLNPEAYILTIAANHTMNQIQKHLSEKKMRQRLARLMREKFENNADELLLLHDSQTMVRQAVDKLPPQQKRVYQLSRDEGLNYDEIAGTMDISRHTVRNHLVEALRSIRQYVDDQGPVPPSLVALAILLLKK
jgi:RNA polymerase sigma-70 factor (ECF subfamily)